jgi:hypothetical protein
MCRTAVSRHHRGMSGIRWVAAVVVGAAGATSLTGCGAGGWCTPLEPSISVTKEYEPTTTRLETIPGVTEVTTRYWQPDDSHCVSREYLETAPWSADHTVRVRSGFTLEQVRAVRTALGSSTGTVAASAGDGLSAWRLVLANPSGATPSPSDAPLLVDEQGFRLVTQAAALPDVTIAEQGTSTTIRVRTPAAMRATAAWLREHLPATGSSSLDVGTPDRWSASISVTGPSGVSDTTIATTAEVLGAHPDVREVSVSRTLVVAEAPTRRQARQVVAAYERTAADAGGQGISVSWPDGDGTVESGMVGSAR